MKSFYLFKVRFEMERVIPAANVRTREDLQVEIVQQGEAEAQKLQSFRIF